MVTLGIMLAGIAVGRFFPERHKAKNEWAQLAFTLLLIFSMGVGLGQREGFFSELAVLGLRSFLLFLLPTLCSVAVVYVLTRCCMGEGAAVRETAGGRQESAPVQMGSDPMVFFALGALLLGVVCGAFPACAAVLSPLTAHTQWLLYALMFSVGVSVGLRRGLLESIRKYHMRILVIPCGIIAGSLLGGLLCGLLMAYPVNQTVSVAAGIHRQSGRCRAGQHCVFEQPDAGDRGVFHDPLSGAAAELFHLYRACGGNQRGYHPAHAHPPYQRGDCGVCRDQRNFVFGCGARADRPVLLTDCRKNKPFDSLSIKTTFSIENAAVCARFSGTLASGLNKNRDTCSRFLWASRLAAMPYFMRAAARIVHTQ